MKRQIKIVNLLTPGDLVRVKYSPQDKTPRTGFYLGEKEVLAGWLTITVSVVILEDGTLLEVENKFVQRISAAAKV
jgi:hypothetical protein